MADLMDVLNEDTVHQIKIVKLFSAEEKHLQEFDSCGRSSAKPTFKANIVDLIECHLTDCLQSIGCAFAMFLCYWKLTSGNLSLGNFGAFIMFNQNFRYVIF